MTIRYQSTRGEAPELNFEDVVLAGLASDGGLYVPTELPHFSPSDLVEMANLSYEELAFKVIQPFTQGCLTDEELRALLAKSYAEFRHKAIAPLKQLDSNLWLMELFHGPTLAFKDFALQFLGNLMDLLLTRRGEHVTVLGATSGDTGSAAIAGCRGREHMDIYILLPDGRVSDVQRKQMTTVADANVHVLAVDGTFDDCQNIVKTLFTDADFKKEQHLVAVNSINWARILAQVVYYFHAALSLGAPAKAVSFAVPTGNFGDIYAGFLAKRMGLPIDTLLIASNSNDILTRCYDTGRYHMDGVTPTLSPSMDIQISSNFERLLFDLSERDASVVRGLMASLKEKGEFTLTEAMHRTLKMEFAAERADDAQTKATIEKFFEEDEEVLDPHTAVGVFAAECHAKAAQKTSANPMVVLSTAHPAKFPDAVKEACGIHPALPPHMEGLFEKEERISKVPNSAEAVKAKVAA